MSHNEQHIANDLPLSEMENCALHMVASHWRTYYTASEPDRLGDAEQWDTVLKSALGELGIVAERAHTINEVAKLEAQFME